MMLFFALCFVGVAIAGLSAFAIFWPLTLIHVRDRHAASEHDFGEGAFMKPAALGWLLSGRYRGSRDPSLTGLATPARVALITIFTGLGASLLLWLLSEIFG